MEFSLPQIAQGAGLFFGALGVAVYGLKKNGKIHFGMPKERRNCVRLCSEHTGLVNAIENNTQAQAINNEKLDGVASKVDKILGHLDKF